MAAAAGFRECCGASSLALPKSGLEKQTLAISSGYCYPLSKAFKGLSCTSLPSKEQNLTSRCISPGQLCPLAGSATTTMSLEAGVGVLGNKVGMLTWFTEDGQAVPCTVIGFHEGNIVTQVKTADTCGYDAVQVAYRRVRESKLTKPELGHLKKVGAQPMRHLQEFRLLSAEGFEPGQQLNVADLFSAGDLVDVVGTSIGKGFQGGIKRHNFARGPMSHGSKSHRQLGSIGAGTTPGRVYPGKKMPGRMGNARVKVRKLKVMKVDMELNALLIKGAVPGKAGNLLRITPAKIVGKNIPKN